jgi:EAL domain-containing protein (putative c-di-GMP-specific phosphodiesterase class I)
MLAAMGCDRAQGYYAQPALPATQLERWLAHSWPAVSIAV